MAVPTANHRYFHPENGKSVINETPIEGFTITGEGSGGGTPEGASNDAGGGTASVTATFTNPETNEVQTLGVRCSGGGSEKDGVGRTTLTSPEGSPTFQGRDDGC